MKKKKILKNEFEFLWNNLWNKTTTIQHNTTEKEISSSKYYKLKNGYKIGDKSISFQYIVNKSSTKWQSPEWGFPKGRRNHLEKDITCAIREFEEETGFDSKKIEIIENILPYEEIFTGSNFKTYKNRYYLAFTSEKLDNINNYQKSEVSRMKWATFDQSLQLIRPYNLEKKKIIKKINNMLKSMILIL